MCIKRSRIPLDRERKSTTGGTVPAMAEFQQFRGPDGVIGADGTLTEQILDAQAAELEASSDQLA